jgi:hypothetical protein
VRRGILPGNSKSLWDAVKIAKNKGVEVIRQVLYLNQQEIKNENSQDLFPSFFDNKIRAIINSSNINEEVYNCKKSYYRIIGCLWIKNLLDL